VLAGGQPECTPTLNQERFNPASSLVRCVAPPRWSEPVGMVRSGAAAAILVATALSRSRSITLDSPVVTVGLRSSIRPTRSRLSPGVVISLGGSRVHAARLSTWWKQPGGSLTLPTRLNRLQPRAVRPIGSPEDGPSCPGSSRRLRSFNQFGRSAFRAYGKVPHVCSPKLTQAVCSWVSKGWSLPTRWPNRVGAANDPQRDR